MKLEIADINGKLICCVKSFLRGGSKLRQERIFMDVKEFYETVGEDYDVAICMVGNDDVIKQKLKSFLEDSTMKVLSEYIHDKKAKNACKTIRAFMNVAFGLCFFSLANKASKLEEQLSEERFKSGYLEAYNNLREEYLKTIESAKKVV